MRTHILAVSLIMAAWIAPTLNAASVSPGFCESDYLDACRQGYQPTVSESLRDQKRLDHYRDCVDQEGNTCLLIASRSSRENLIKLLINCRVNIEQVDEKGMTALMWAVTNGNFSIAKVLVKEGHAEVENSNARGDTAIKIAQREGFVDIEHFLEANRERWTDAAGQSIWILIALGCAGGFLLTLFEFFEGSNSSAPPGGGRRLVAWFGIPALGGFLVYVFVLTGALLTPLLALGLGISGPALIRAWRMNPLTYSLGDLSKTPPPQPKPPPP